MSATSIEVVGEPLPRLRFAKAIATRSDPFGIEVRWKGKPAYRAGRVDLAPYILTYKLYRPLRDDPALFASLRIVDSGAAIAWGEDEAIDMAASTVAELADETMEGADFKAFMARRGLTLDGAAATLGISRRLVAYYASGRIVPRTVALACKYLDAGRHPRARTGLRPAANHEFSYPRKQKAGS